MKKAICLLAVFWVGLSFIGYPVKGEAAEKILIKCVSSWPASHVANKYLFEYIKMVNDKAKGELEIKHLGGPEVIATFDQLKALSLGTVDMINSCPDYFIGIVPEGTIPSLARFPHQLKAFRESGIIEMFNQVYRERVKAVVLMWGPNLNYGTYITSARKPIAKLEDIRGLKLRSLGGMSDVIVGELGGAVVKLPSHEVYEALQRGVVDGSVRNPQSIMEFKEYEVLKYILSPPIYLSTGLIWIGEEKWNAIPKHLQTMMKELAIGVEVEAAKFIGDLTLTCLKELEEKHGMKVIHLSDTEVEKMNEIRSGAAIKDWIYKRAPKYGPSIYEKMLPYIK